MIKLKIDSKVFLSQINSKVDAVKELVAPSVLQEVAKAAFTITGERFVNAVDRESVQNPKKLHHVYEWGRLGSPDGRLFVLERAGILNGNLSINTSFLPSTVPVPSKVMDFGKGPKTISSQDIFRYKASVMEKNAPVSYVTAKISTFFSKGDQVFVAPGTKITILNPGGVSTKNAFADFMINWYVQNANVIMDSSGLYEKIAQEAAAVLSTTGGGISQVRKAVASITNMVSQGKEVIR